MLQFADLLRRQPLPGGVLLRGLPAADGREDHLVRQVMALANADIAGTRCLIFGVEQGTAGALSVIGLTDREAQRLEAQLGICRDAVEPALDLALETGEIDGQRVAALVLDHCVCPPYVATAAAPATLRAGECWLFDAQGMRPATRGDLDDMYATRRQRQAQVVFVGIGDDPRCECLDVRVPDAADAPSRLAAMKLKSAIAAKKMASSIMGREDTGMARLAHARIFGADMPYRRHGVDTLVRSLETVPEDYRQADLHHRFEVQAVRLNIAIMNGTTQPLRDAVIEFTLPDVPGFAVATQLYPAPGATAPADSRYPDVRRAAGCFRVRASLGQLEPARVVPAFATKLRLAVDRALVGHKIAIRYSLVADGLDSPRHGRLRVKFHA